MFLTFGTAMWAQLAVGWQWAPPATTATTVAMLLMSGPLLFLALLALLADPPQVSRHAVATSSCAWVFHARGFGGRVVAGGWG